MRGDNFRPASLCKNFKKWKDECRDKTSKPIDFLPSPPMENAWIKSLPTNKNVLMSSLESRVANVKVDLSISKVCDTSDEGDLIMQ